jgi:hypothetical protein
LDLTLDEKELVNSLKVEWKRLWVERLDDKVRAEGVAINNYSTLFVDKGTVIHATRDFKALNFREILDKHQVDNADRYISPSPSVGGWGKFIKNDLPKKETRHKRAETYRIEEEKVKQQSKKGGRGWLHK